jgi:hypothetical protein
MKKVFIHDRKEGKRLVNCYHAFNKVIGDRIVNFVITSGYSGDGWFAITEVRSGLLFGLIFFTHNPCLKASKPEMEIRANQMMDSKIERHGKDHILYIIDNAPALPEGT